LVLSHCQSSKGSASLSGSHVIYFCCVVNDVMLVALWCHICCWESCVVERDRWRLIGSKLLFTDTGGMLLTCLNCSTTSTILKENLWESWHRYFYWMYAFPVTQSTVSKQWKWSPAQALQAYRVALIAISVALSQTPAMHMLQDHRYRAIALHDVCVYTPAFTPVPIQICTSCERSRHLGVNDLPMPVTWHCSSWELDWQP